MLVLCIGQAGIQVGQHCKTRLDAQKRHHMMVFVDTERKTLDKLPFSSTRSKFDHRQICMGSLGRGNNWVHTAQLTFIGCWVFLR